MSFRRWVDGFVFILFYFNIVGYVLMLSEGAGIAQVAAHNGFKVRITFNPGTDHVSHIFIGRPVRHD